MSRSTVASQAVASVFVIAAFSAFGVALTSLPSGAGSMACRPLSNAGHCYEPGEFCRHSDRGVKGIAGDGKRIVCRNNDGLRWEPY
jgi:hypothetical protein